MHFKIKQGYFILIFFLIIINTLLSQVEMKTLEKICKNEYKVLDRTGSINNIKFDKNESLSVIKNPFFQVTKDLSNYFSITDKKISLTLLSLKALDAPVYTAITVDNKYGLFLDLYNRDNLFAFNFLISCVKPIKILDTNKAKQFVDFYLRTGSDFFISYYRINKYDDIWLYPQYYQFLKNNTDDFELNSTSFFNEKLLVENVSSDSIKFLSTCLTEYENYKSQKKLLYDKIEPCVIRVKDEFFIIDTFIADAYKGNIEKWTITLTKAGIIEEVKKNIIKQGVGIKNLEIYGLEKLDLN